MMALDNSKIATRTSHGSIVASQVTLRASALPSKASTTSSEFSVGRAQADRSVASRKLRLLKRAGLFGEDTKGATIERACGFEDLRSAYRLVHQVYLNTGFINPEPAAIRLRIFETSSETATFVAKKDGQVVGVLSVVGDSREFGLPSDAAFKVELDSARAKGKKLCELTNQAVAEEYRSSSVPTELMRCAIAHAIKAGYHAGVATVSPSHNGFYNLIGFQTLGAERSYSTKLHDPVIALSMDMDQFRRPTDEMGDAGDFLHHYAFAGNPYLAHVVAWDKKARANFLNPDMLEQLFVIERNFLAECSAAELDILKRRWGQELFAAVTDTQPFIHSEEWEADIAAAASTTVSASPFGATRNYGLSESPFSFRSKETPVRLFMAHLHQCAEFLAAAVVTGTAWLRSSLLQGADRKLIADS